MRYVTSVERLATRRGLQQGLEQGMEQGLEQGKLVGGAGVLERLLTRRFGALPDETRERLANATAEQLDLWTDRILDAPLARCGVDAKLTGQFSPMLWS